MSELVDGGRGVVAAKESNALFWLVPDLFLFVLYKILWKEVILPEACLL